MRADALDTEVFFESADAPGLRFGFKLFWPQIERLGLSTTVSNSAKWVALSHEGLHICLSNGVLTYTSHDVPWRDIWTHGEGMETGVCALLAWKRMVASYVPKQKARGKRGRERGRLERDFMLAAAIAENISTGASAEGAGLRRAAARYPDIADAADFQPGDTDGSLRQYIRRHLKKAASN